MKKMTIKASWRWSGEPIELDAGEHLMETTDPTTIGEAVNAALTELRNYHVELTSKEVALHLYFDEV